MSASNAAARKRRAPQSLENTPPPQPQQNNVSNVNTGLTLPQVISILDVRLLKVENYIKEMNDNHNNIQPHSLPPPEYNEELINEFNNRFEILAEEIGNLKDVVLKLQTYTMDVNKILFDERKIDGSVNNVISNTTENSNVIIPENNDVIDENGVSENIILQDVNNSNDETDVKPFVSQTFTPNKKNREKKN